MSTSSIGKDEEYRKPLLENYLFERRLLLGCVGMLILTLIVWIVAISTNHWFIISGGEGKYLFQTRRYFMKSNSGIWKIYRHVVIPKPLNTSAAVRNFTIFSPPNLIKAKEQKNNQAGLEIFKQFTDVKLPPLEDIKSVNDEFLKKLFGVWIQDSDGELFKKYMEHYKNITTYVHPKMMGHPVALDPLNSTAVKEMIGEALVAMNLQGEKYHIIVPIGVQRALFSQWRNYTEFLPLYKLYAVNMKLPGFPTHLNSSIAYLKPPLPPKKDRFAYGYEYIKNVTQKTIDMSNNALTIDRTIDQKFLDFNRTLASFACVTLIVMVMGIAFSIYTFLNPRYTFKRLAAGIHFLSASSCLVVTQFSLALVQHQEEHLKFNFPIGSTYSFGFSTYLGWIVFGGNVLAFILFLMYSGKRKGNRAPTDDLAMVDEPTIMGR